MVEGIHQNGMNMWLGIPFAKPPVGELRFKRARKPEPWDGVLKCQEMGPGPIQFAAGSMKMMTDQKYRKNEDCLYLNIKAPENARMAPVFVWIYGGANSIGEASAPEYLTDAFPRDGVIGVSFNYRVGPLGFYDFSALDHRFESNCAASDMIAAMQWIHENIAAFGGDPENVTICGESAGGTAVYTLLAAPTAKGTFQKAIAQSGLAGNVTNPQTHRLNNGLFLKKLRLNEGDISELLTMDVERMIDAAGYVLAHNNVEYPGILVSGPVIDELIPWTPWEAIENGNADDVTCMFGTCRDEGNLFYALGMTPKSWKEIQRMLELNDIPEKLEDLKKLYHGMSEKKAMQSIGRDRMFWVDYMKCTLAKAERGTVYSFRFDFEPFLARIAGLHATHGMDICCGLDTWSGKMYLPNLLTSKKRLQEIHKVMHGAFVDFCKTGIPDLHMDEKWKPYIPEKPYTFIFNDICSHTNSTNRINYELWKDIELYNQK